MTDTERKVAALVALAENYGKELSKTLLPIWMRLLEPYTPAEVDEAVVRVIESYEFKTLPPFAELKKFLPRRGNDLPDPEEARKVKAEAEWQHLLEDISHFGYYNEPTLMHPTTAYVLRGMGGWTVACGWLESELHYRRKEFVESWCRTDGLDIAMLEGGARAIEQRQAQIALGMDDDRTLKRITRDSIKRLKAESETEGRA